MPGQQEEDGAADHPGDLPGQSVPAPQQESLGGQPGGQQQQEKEGQPPAVLGPVEPVQGAPYLHRVPHLGHRPPGGLLLRQARPAVVRLLVGDVVGQLPAQQLPGPPPADLGPHLF